MEDLVNMLDFNIYKDKKVFLTGHTGFKGTWMLRWLKMLGAEVKGYALKPLNDFDLYHTINADSFCESIINDIRDRSYLIEEVRKFQPDFIFHMAAQPLVRLSYELPAETFEVNVIGTANLLDALKFVDKHCACIIVTTDKVYHNREWQYPYRENDSLGGYDPYSASKAAAELLVSSYRNSFFNQNDFESHKKSISTARAGNVIGGGDWAKDRIIPDIVRSLRQNETIKIRNPKSVRPWQHVLEPISGYLQLAAQMYTSPMKYDGEWNFGPNIGDNLTVEEIVQKAIQIWGKGNYLANSDLRQPHEAGLLKLDISKAQNELAWHPKLKADEAISWTIDFYKSDSPSEMIRKQIEAYQII